MFPAVRGAVCHSVAKIYNSDEEHGHIKVESLQNILALSYFKSKKFYLSLQFLSSIQRSLNIFGECAFI